MSVSIIIPARFASTRFPGKPLADICGKSLIQRVWERCIRALPPSKVYVATDSEKIAAHCNNHGIQTVMTSSNCLTGTDRVWEASKAIDAEIYVNVQGDEPLIEPEDIKKVIAAAEKAPGQVVNAMCPITEEQDFRSVTVPKVVARPDGRLLYMSRCAIPTNKNLGFESANKQVCIYALNKSALEVFAKVETKTPLEELEDIEILRFLELGIDVHMVSVSSTSIAVDTPEDVRRVEAAIRLRGL